MHKRPLNVLVVYPFLFHYRFGVFQQLDRSPELRLTFASDTRTFDGIEAIDPHLVARHKKLKTIRINRFTWQTGLAKLITTEAYDAVVFHGDMWSISTWIASAIARIRRKKVFFWTIGWHRPDKGLMKFIRLSFYKLAHELLIYGNVGKSIGKSMGYPEDTMTVIYNSHVSSKSATNDRQNHSILIEASNIPTIGAVIRLNAVKRLDLMLKSAAILRDRGEPVRIILAGEGPEAETLRALGLNLGLEVTFVGSIYSAHQIEQFYEKVDLTVVPAAAGLTVIQSMSHGVAVITDDDDFGQMPEAEAVIDGVTGGRFKSGDANALADTIRTWLDFLEVDPLRIDRATRREVQLNWTPEAQADRIQRRLLRHLGSPE